MPPNSLLSKVLLNKQFFITQHGLVITYFTYILFCKNIPLCVRMGCFNQWITNFCYYFWIMSMITVRL